MRSHLADALVENIAACPKQQQPRGANLMATFDSTKLPLQDILADIVKGKIQLPDFQRGWVWDDSHIRSLLVSVAKSFPVGAVMLLENGGNTRFQLRGVEGVTPAPDPATAEQLILDGQQRLTTLTQVLAVRAAVATRTDKGKPIERHYYWHIPTALDPAVSFENPCVGGSIPPQATIYIYQTALWLTRLDSSSAVSLRSL